MPVLSKFRFKTPFDEFENYLGEEMNTFSGFYTENYVEEDSVEIIIEENCVPPNEISEQKSIWNRIVSSIFKFSSELF